MDGDKTASPQYVASPWSLVTVAVVVVVVMGMVKCDGHRKFNGGDYSGASDGD